MPARSPRKASEENPSGRLLLTIAYDGAAHAGWQSQTTRDGVQDRIEGALECIFGRAVRIHGAGRTDAGVHANGQTAHFDPPSDRLSPSRLVNALNGNLPRTIRIESARQISPRFHARFDATGKTYRYRAWLAPWHHPLELGRSWHFPFPCDWQKLRPLASRLEGEHDFAAFCANRGKPEPDTVRTLYAVKVRKRGPLLELSFTGSGFLYRMVRMLAGGMLDSIREGRSVDAFLEQLENPDRRILREAAPAHGLYLDTVHYRPITSDHQG